MPTYISRKPWIIQDQVIGNGVSRLLTPWPGRLEHPKMFSYLPQNGASPLWPVLFVWVFLTAAVVS